MTHVPAVDRQGNQWWLDDKGEPHRMALAVNMPRGWRPMSVPAEPAPPACVPAVDDDGNELWRAPNGWPSSVRPGDIDAADAHVEGWRRLCVHAEPAAFDHSDRCESDDDLPHLSTRFGGCLCLCDKCQDPAGFCICPQCSAPSTHAHRPVMS